jgi:hypothetical protein
MIAGWYEVERAYFVWWTFPNLADFANNRYGNGEARGGAAAGGCVAPARVVESWEDKMRCTWFTVAYIDVECKSYQQGRTCE